MTPKTTIHHISSALSPSYVMGFNATLSQDRVESYFDGKLNCQELVLLAQDAIEVGAVHCDRSLMRLAAHCIGQGLCTENGRLLQ